MAPANDFIVFDDHTAERAAVSIVDSIQGFADGFSASISDFIWRVFVQPADNIIKRTDRKTIKAFLVPVIMISFLPQLIPDMHPKF